jgi:hypothetical protein
MCDDLPKTWTKNVLAFWEEFLKQTDFQVPTKYANGFIGVGILKEKEDHGEGKKVNSIVIMWYLTFDEAPDCFNRVAIMKKEAQDLLISLTRVLKKV